MKININSMDYSWQGVGYNNYNFINNVAPRISLWLLDIFNKNNNKSINVKEAKLLAQKLEKISKIIDEELSDE